MFDIKKLLEKNQLKYHKEELDKKILLSKIEFKKDQLRIISIGHACQVTVHIRNLGLQDTETEFFDWLITDFSSLYYLLNNDNIFDYDNFTDQPVFKEGKSWYKKCHKIEHKKFKMISIHDFPSNISWNNIEEKKKYIDKYIRRWDRFKINFSKFKKNKLVSVFAHQFIKCYIPSKEEIVNVLNKLSILSNGNEYQIHFVCVPNLYTNIKMKEFEQTIKSIENCYFYVLKKINNFKRTFFKDEHLNWYEIFFDIISNKS